MNLESVSIGVVHDFLLGTVFEAQLPVEYLSLLHSVLLQKPLVHGFVKLVVAWGTGLSFIRFLCSWALSFLSRRQSVSIFVHNLSLLGWVLWCLDWLINYIIIVFGDAVILAGDGAVLLTHEVFIVRIGCR